MSNFNVYRFFTIASLRLYDAWQLGRPVHPLDFPHHDLFAHRVLLQGGDDDRVRMYVERYDIVRHVVASRHSEPVSLADGVERSTVMLTYHAPVSI